jgi:hypothetical protein
VDRDRMQSERLVLLDQILQLRHLVFADPA